MHNVSFKKKAEEEPEEPAEPETKECPFCLSEIPYHAVKCKCCGSDQPENTEN
jgi:large conductance mechanosensitive channel